MSFHLNIVPGDFIFNEWDEDGFSKLKEKEIELESQGYKFNGKDNDFLNEHFEYKDSNDNTKVITFCRC